MQFVSIADYDALRALDADNPHGVTAMSDTDISRLPVRMYKGSTQTPVTESLPMYVGQFRSKLHIHSVHPYFILGLWDCQHHHVS